MNEITFKAKLDEYVSRDYEIEREFVAGDSLSIEESSPLTIRIVLPSGDDETRLFVSAHVRNNYRESYMTGEATSELGYADSLEWFYTYYKWGQNYNSNGVLVNKSGQVLAISYNGVNAWSFIKTDCLRLNDYVVLNKGWKIDGEWQQEEINLLIKEIKI